MSSATVIGRRKPWKDKNQINSPIKINDGPDSQPLTFAESQYLLACERGDLATVRFHLMNDDRRHFDTNCSDSLGRTALRIAIENENTEMIELLLENSVDVGDSLLHAISEENVEAVELLLRHNDMQSGKSNAQVRHRFIEVSNEL
jgi:ankyrin repeat protein